MDKEMLQVYTARITQANRSELVVIIYEIIINDLEMALKAYENKDKVIFDKELRNAQKFLSELISSLDFNFSIAKNLMELYLYVNKSILTAIVKQEPELVEQALDIMKQLMIGFEGVAKEDHSDPVMQNTQQLYAGLTYGKGTLNETYVNLSEQNRGFKA